MRPRRPSECISSRCKTPPPEAEKAAVDAKEALTQVVVTTPSADLAQGEDETNVPMCFQKLLEQLGINLSEEQQLKVASIKGSQSSTIDSPSGLDVTRSQETSVFQLGPRDLRPKAANGKGSTKGNNPGGKGQEGQGRNGGGFLFPQQTTRTARKP